MTYAIPTEVHEPLLIHGDALEEMAKLPDSSVDLCIADQPSGLGFMSKPWDSFAGYEPRTQRGREVDAQLGGGDLLARAAEFLGGVGLSSRLDGLVGVDGVATGARALGLAEELRAAAGTRALMPPWARGVLCRHVERGLPRAQTRGLRVRVGAPEDSGPGWARAPGG